MTVIVKLSDGSEIRRGGDVSRVGAGPSSGTVHSSALEIEDRAGHVVAVTPQAVQSFAEEPAAECSELASTR